ncbi:hypothetical protein LCGC14_0926820 [marine sediment metagenome]|uniref:Uncharacterized protein n=1 Tax=marine sediment metagenome TaxID=412755 RepID=A0A0F9NTX5_9ZZZZ
MPKSLADKIDEYVSGKGQTQGVPAPKPRQSLKDILGPENMMPTNEQPGPELYKGEGTDRGMFDKIMGMIKRLSPGMDLSKQPGAEREKQFFPKSPGYKY